jgi:hypothetical protein
VRGEYCRTCTAEGIKDQLTFPAAVANHAGRLGRRMQVVDVWLIDLEHIVLSAIVYEIVGAIGVTNRK